MKIWLVLAFLCVFILASESKQSDMLLLEEEDPKYEVVIKQGTHSAKEFKPEQIENLITLNLNGEDYLCSLPEQLKNKTQTTSYHKSANSEALTRIMAMDDVCFYRMTWWWVYELCVNKHVRQFHQEQNKVTAEFYLGHLAHGQTLTAAAKEAQVLKTFKVVPNAVAEESYVSVTYKDGTACDLTGQTRQTEVRFYCPTEERVANMIKQQQSVNPSAVINKEKMQWIESVEEPATCTYVLKFYTNSLCDIGGFEKEEGVVNKIQCVALLPQKIKEKASKPSESNVEKEPVKPNVNVEDVKQEVKSE